MRENQYGRPDPAAVRQAARRVMQRCDELAGCSEDVQRLTRTFCSDAMQRAHALARTWMHTAGMSTRLDAAGNLVGRWQPRAETDKVFLIGSHLDSVIDAGKYDGPLGVLLGIAAAELLQDADAELMFAVDVVGFSEEEGVRFRTPFLGSRALAGTFDPGLFALVDSNGCTVREALLDFGADPTAIDQASYRSDELIGFLEPHIEQGPLLERIGQPLGVVAAISGQTRATFLFRGNSGHAGTVPHVDRRDALAAAAEFIIGVENVGQQTEGLFATVGQITVEPNLSNVLVGRAQVRLDLRHVEDPVRRSAFETLRAHALECGLRRRVAVEAVDCQHQPAVPLSGPLRKQLRCACEEAGLVGASLISGAGHDAMIMSDRAPSCMLFLRCRGGVSHHPDESVDVEDVVEALNVIVRFLLRIGQPSNRSK